MLHYYHGVAHVAQLFEGVYKSLVITLVQSYGWLIEYVQHVHQLGAHLRGEPYALAFASRESLGRPVERHVVQAHVEHKLQSGPYLLYYLFGYALFFFAKMLLCLCKPGVQFAYVHVAQFENVLVPYLVGQGFLVQSGTITCRAHLHLFFLGFIVVLPLAVGGGSHRVVITKEAQALAQGAGTLRGVEGEDVWRGVFVCHARCGTHQAL